MAVTGMTSPEGHEGVLAEALVSGEHIDAESMDRARRLARQEGQKLWHILPRLGMIAERRLTELMAEAFDLPLAAADSFPDQPLFADRISARFLREFNAVPISDTAERVTIAIAEPDNEYAIQAIGQALQRPVDAVLATPTEIGLALERYFADGRSTIARLSEEETDLSEAVGEEELALLAEGAGTAPVVQLVNHLIEKAVDAGASDIHIEPFERKLLVRFRIDGVLSTIESPPWRMRDAIVSRIKLMANLDVAERRLPQDGRIKVPVRGVPVDMRVSTMPSISGEGVVLRILDRSQVEMRLDRLGFDAPSIKLINRLIRRPSGILLVTGPTGSGKTTTLYAALDSINDSERKILTVEDPVEFQIPGIVQTQIRPAIKLGFAEVLRSALRHDPDVILVGEIRDVETAEIAIQAALTGHMVFSTVHTNSAIGTITRLVDMGIEPHLLGATLGGVVAQRLVRCLCDQCKEPVEVDRAAIEWALGPGSPSKKKFTVYRAVGCDACNGTGYRGRTVIYEILEISEDLRHALARFTGQQELAEIARKAGVRSLVNCGIEKAFEGVTSVEEVMRVSIDA